jgi:hypothetical protein
MFLPPCYGATVLQGFALPWDFRDQNVQLVITVTLFHLDLLLRSSLRRAQRGGKYVIVPPILLGIFISFIDVLNPLST